MKFRIAKENDLSQIVEMLADDPLGSKRERFTNPLPDSYYSAFLAIDADPNNELIVIEEEKKVIGTMQLTFIPYLTFKGGLRAQIEAVRIHKDFRDRGFGKALFRWAIDRAKQRNCHLVQLTTNKDRNRAFDFYEDLGFKATHEGMKLYLKPW